MRRFEFPLRLATLVLFLGTIGVSSVMIKNSELLEARMLKEPTVKTAKDLEWKIFDEEAIEAGVVIPPSTHVVLYLPYDVTMSGSILREVLFGGQGYSVRYWGYCFPADKTISMEGTLTGFPGQIFLSEAERSARNAAARKKLRILTPLHPPTKAELERRDKPYDSRIRHQKEIFDGGEHCYIMTAKQLNVGTDSDEDRLNTALEKKYGTSTEWEDLDGDGVADGYDTDQDGLSDGVEALDSHTNPLQRDTDQDGIIDGVEDADRDGIVDLGETNPLNPDSDRDGLCDGYCVLGKQTRTCRDFMHTVDCTDNGPQFAGEDRNLNGVVDEGETSPLLWDSKEDGYSDLQRYYKCLLDGGDDC